MEVIPMLPIKAAADALDANDTATDVFNYTLSDGTATDMQPSQLL